MPRLWSFLKDCKSTIPSHFPREVIVSQEAGKHDLYL
jgi:hypothetical protein